MVTKDVTTTTVAKAVAEAIPTVTKSIPEKTAVTPTDTEEEIVATASDRSTSERDLSLSAKDELCPSHHTVATISYSLQCPSVLNPILLRHWGNASFSL